MDTAWLTGVENAWLYMDGNYNDSIHAVTPRGFELKVFLTVLAYSITA